MLLKFIVKYKLEILIVFLHLLGTFGSIGVLIGSLYIFYLIAFKKNLDFVSIFILLLPSIALSGAETILGFGLNQYGETTWFKLYFPTLKNVLLIGPIAVSVKFFAALAVPFRLLLFIKNSSRKELVFLWFFCMFISLYGLFLSVSGGVNSAGGLTVGLRIVLAIGVILFPLSIDLEELESQLMIIVKASIVLFILGLLNAHWIFVAAAFPPFLIFSKEKAIWRFLGLFVVMILLLTGSTFTIKLTLLFSFILLILVNKKTIFKSFLRFKLSTFLLFLFPLLLMTFIVLKVNPNSENTGIQTNRFYSKLYKDRKVVWGSTIDLIKKSDFFIVPAGRDMEIQKYGTIGNRKWGAGSHNIYLEMARQLGLFVTICLSFIMGYFLLGSIWNLKGNSFLSKFIWTFFAAYLVFGLTGNSLIYDGVGFLYWLIIGQIYQVSKLEEHYEGASLISC